MPSSSDCNEKRQILPLILEKRRVKYPLLPPSPFLIHLEKKNKNSVFFKSLTKFFGSQKRLLTFFFLLPFLSAKKNEKTRKKWKNFAPFLPRRLLDARNPEKFSPATISPQSHVVSRFPLQGGLLCLQRERTAADERMHASINNEVKLIFDSHAD